MMTLFKVLSFLFFFHYSISHAKVTRFDMRDGAQRNLVHFVSDAVLETVVGLSTAVWGWAELDPQNIRKGLKAEFELDVRTFNTGMPARDNILIEKVFLALLHPVAKYTVSRVLKSSTSRLYANKETVVEVDGNLSFRGLSRKERATVYFTYLKESAVTRQRLSGNLLKVHTVMELDLAKYQFEIPRPWVKRFSSKVRVEVNAIGTDHSPANKFDLPQGPKPKERS